MAPTNQRRSPRRRCLAAATAVATLVVGAGVALAGAGGSSITDDQAAGLADQAFDDADLAAPGETIVGDSISRPDLFLPAEPDNPDTTVTTLAILEFRDGTAGEVTVWTEPDKAIGELTLGPSAFCIGLPSGTQSCYGGFNSPQEPRAIGGSDGDHGATVIALPVGTAALHVDTGTETIRVPALAFPDHVADGAVAVIANDLVQDTTGPVGLIAVDGAERAIARTDDGLPRR